MYLHLSSFLTETFSWIIVYNFLAFLCSFITFVLLIFFFFFFFAFSRATSCGIWRFPGWGSNWSCSHRPMPEPQQCGIRAASATYTTAHGNARSLIHWARPGIETATSWFPVRFLNHWATMGTPETASYLLTSCPCCGTCPFYHRLVNMVIIYPHLPDDICIHLYLQYQCITTTTTF